MSARLQEVQQSIARLQGRRDASSKRIKRLQGNIETADARLDVQFQVLALLQQLLDVLIRHKAREVADLLTDGCQSIFSDMKLSVQEIVGVERGKVSVTFETVENKEGDIEIRGDAVDSFGGGVAAVQGMLLRLYTVLGKGMRPIIVADEPLATVSAQYIPAVGSFLYQVCESSGLDLLMVTHQQGFIEHASTVYEARRKGDVTEVIRLS